MPRCIDLHCTYLITADHYCVTYYCRAIKLHMSYLKTSPVSIVLLPCHTMASEYLHVKNVAWSLALTVSVELFTALNCFFCCHCNCWSADCERTIKTRSQAVARIADHTAKNCKGHVT